MVDTNMSTSHPSPPTARVPLSMWKKLLFTVITMSIPLVLLAIVELGLRLFGWGGYPPFFRMVGEVAPNQQLWMVEPAASTPYFFANPTRPGYAEQSSFVMPKPAGTVRIFLFGESAAKGYPQPRNLAMSSFMEAMLTDAWPGRTVEVINMGTTAVASFPIIPMVSEAVALQPDLFVFYVGNNEFFGAYGTASINSAGTLPDWALPWMRAARGLGVVQVFDRVFQRSVEKDRTLMEQMIGQTVIAADSPLRDAAARNLNAHLGQMLDAAQAAGIPTIVCTTASNESGVAPLGEGGGASERFAEAKKLSAAGDRVHAAEAFLAARDLDTMPWRPTSSTENSIRRAALSHNAPLCDIAARFRQLSPEGATGWELADDHVHLTVRGQAEAARAIAETMATLPPPLAVDPVVLAALPSWQSYAQRLGTNNFDDYRVHHTLRILFGIPFMKRSNAEAFTRFNTLCQEAESRMSVPIADTVRQWQTMTPHAGGLRPITGMVARTMLRDGNIAEAARLYEIACSQVPPYTSWQIEYVYFLIACHEKLHGSLTEADRARAADVIADGQFLLKNGYSSSGLTERYVGRLHQLRGEWAASIPYLQDARSKLNADDLVACDQALVMALVKTGRAPEAADVIERGIRDSGKFSSTYRQMREQLLPKR